LTEIFDREPRMMCYKTKQDTISCQWHLFYCQPR